MGLWGPVPTAATIAAVSIAFVGCGKAKSARGPEASITQCVGCHGSFDNSAPPVSVHGALATTDPGVGAHQAHLHPGPYRKALACDECHAVPQTVDSPGHMGKGFASVTFGGLAIAHGASPVWSPATATCTAVYCHGATLAGGSIRSPKWTQVDGSQVQCGTCHGIPPPTSTGHPAVSGGLPACGTCHPGTVKASGDIDIAGGLHIDGVVQVGAAGCAGCHGDPTRAPAEVAAAPPRDTFGNTRTGAIGVGAHLQHLVASPLRGPLSCSDCHAVPASLAGHPDGQIDLSWSSLARAAGAAPEWSRSTATCSSTYCHGVTLTGGTLTVPVWTQVDGSQVKCGTCHGIPPPAPHVQDQDCGQCHTRYTATTVDPALHINGYVEVNGQTCTSCHGSPLRPTSLQAAPPGDLKGNTDTSALGVGAHQIHLTGTSLRRPIECQECHAPVTSTDHARGKNLQVDMTWGQLATSAGAYPRWDRATATCASTYCHGGTLAGGSLTAPVWTQVDGTQAKCGTCHGVPPPEPHVARTDCGTCHPGYTSTSVNLATHLDGILDAVTLRCTTCHGDATRQPANIQSAPPIDTRGQVALDARGVGAHQKHLVDGVLRAAVACAECHRVPTVSNHADGKVDVSFGALARTGGNSPTWSPSTATCAATYCHGATLAGGSGRTPVWTRVDGTQARCGTCHGVPPPAPHVGDTNCGGCHAGYTQTTVSIATHMNGTLEVTASCTSCHGDATRPVANQSAPPQDTQHNTATTARGVGAHLAHLTDGPLRSAVACSECHQVPIDLTNHPSGTVDVSFGPLARAGGTTPRWSPATASCSATYCHGATLGGGTNREPIWTRVDGTQVACGSCHAIPPPLPHVQNNACGTCHAGYTATTVAAATHINGTVEASGSCTSCHGDAGRPVSNQSAPPQDTQHNTATTARGVGAHLAHLTDGAVRRAVACTECHLVPANLTSHPDGTVHMSFGPLARAGGRTPSWSPSTATCSATYCHGATLAGGAGRTPVWTRVDGSQSACGSCHGNPPPAPHAQNAACGSCHGGYTASSVNLATHLDGVVQASAMTCSSCHGDPGRILVTGADAQTRAAPPVDTRGNATPATLRSIGAHLAHLNKGTTAIGAPVACSECHPVPSAMTHANGKVEVAFGGRARTGGAGPTYNATTTGCAATYCHGQGLTGGSKPTPTWTQVGGLTCTTCHAAPPVDNCHPPQFDHDGGNSCSSCHRDTNAAGTAITNAKLHVDGVVQGKCSDCHNNQNRVCN